MKPSGLRSRGVIYVTLLMTFAVRVLSVFLAVWLTAAAAFPPCCWSMAYAHEHQQTPDTAAGHATPSEHHHGHHESDDSDAVAGTASVLSSIHAYDCDAEFDDAAATPGVVKRALMRPAAEGAADFVVPTISAHYASRSNTSPPGSTVTSAFLKPLRI